MEFRKTKEKEINEVMGIIKKAQDSFREQGIDQWQNGYPNEDVIKDDIDNNHSYVLLKDGNIIATTAVSYDGESTYDKIYDGEWITQNDYAVIHRIAVDSSLRGLGIAKKIISEVEKLCLDKGVYSIKVDTHENNKSMQRLLEKCEFKYCGVIYLPDGDKRVAFEKKINI